MISSYARCRLGFLQDKAKRPRGRGWASPPRRGGRTADRKRISRRRQQDLRPPICSTSTRLLLHPEGPPPYYSTKPEDVAPRARSKAFSPRGRVPAGVAA